MARHENPFYKPPENPEPENQESFLEALGLALRKFVTEKTETELKLDDEEARAARIARGQQEDAKREARIEQLLKETQPTEQNVSVEQTSSDEDGNRDSSSDSNQDDNDAEGNDGDGNDGDHSGGHDDHEELWGEGHVERSAGRSGSYGGSDGPIVDGNEGKGGGGLYEGFDPDRTYANSSAGPGQGSKGDGLGGGRHPFGSMNAYPGSEDGAVGSGPWGSGHEYVGDEPGDTYAGAAAPEGDSAENHFAEYEGFDANTYGEAGNTVGDDHDHDHDGNTDEDKVGDGDKDGDDEDKDKDGDGDKGGWWNELSGDEDSHDDDSHDDDDNNRNDDDDD